MTSNGVRTYRWLLLPGLMMEICYLSFYGVSGGASEVLLFIAVNVVTFALLGLLIWRVRTSPSTLGDGKHSAAIILGMGLLFRLTLVPHGVVGSDDIYRYLWDGNVAASGINPFLYPPNDPRLSHLASGDLPSNVNHPEMRTVYPAVAQLFFLVTHALFGESAAGFKLLLVLIDSLTMLMLWRILRDRGEQIWSLLVYAWSPPPVLYFGLDGHIDALGIFFLAVTMFFVFTRRPVRGSVALAFSALVKIVPLMLVPLLYREAKGSRRVAVVAVPLAIVAAGFVIILQPGGGGVDSLRMFGSRWAFNGGFFMLVYLIVGSNEAAHFVSAGMIAAWIGILAWIDRPLIERVFWAFAGFLILSPVVHPWYLTWLAALLVFRWSLSMYLFLGLSFLANIVVYQYRAYGVWEDQAMILLLEYIPVVVLLGWEVAKGRVLVRGGEG
jgi:hypothetical protein